MLRQLRRPRHARRAFLSFAAWTCCLPLVYFFTHECTDVTTNYPSQVVLGALLSRDALSDQRIKQTSDVLSLKKYMPSADSDCATSSGEVRIVHKGSTKNMCWYANDYLRILKFVSPSKKKDLSYLVCDKDCVTSPSQYFTLSKSRSIEHSLNRTVTLLPSTLVVISGRSHEPLQTLTVSQKNLRLFSGVVSRRTSAGREAYQFRNCRTTKQVRMRSTARDGT